MWSLELSVLLPPVHRTENQTNLIHQKQQQQRDMVAHQNKSAESKHDFVVRSFEVPTRCDHCSSIMIGLVRQGMICKCKKYSLVMYTIMHDYNALVPCTFIGVIAIKIHYFCVFLACSCSCHIRCADKLPTCPITPSLSESHPSLTTAIYCNSLYSILQWSGWFSWRGDCTRELGAYS